MWKILHCLVLSVCPGSNRFLINKPVCVLLVCTNVCLCAGAMRETDGGWGGEGPVQTWGVFVSGGVAAFFFPAFHLLSTSSSTSICSKEIGEVDFCCDGRMLPFHVCV